MRSSFLPGFVLIVFLLAFSVRVSATSDSAVIVFKIDDGAGLDWFDLRRNHVFNINNKLVLPDSVPQAIAINSAGVDEIKCYGPVGNFFTKFKSGFTYTITFLNPRTVIITPEGGAATIGQFKFNVQNFSKNRFAGIYKNYQKILSNADIKSYLEARFEPGMPGLPQYFVLGSVTNKREFPQHMNKLASFNFAFLHGEKISLNYYTFAHKSLIKFEGYVD